MLKVRVHSHWAETDNGQYRSKCAIRCCFMLSKFCFIQLSLKRTLWKNICEHGRPLQDSQVRLKITFYYKVEWWMKCEWNDCLPMVSNIGNYCWPAGKTNTLARKSCYQWNRLTTLQQDIKKKFVSHIYVFFKFRLFLGWQQRSII